MAIVAEHLSLRYGDRAVLRDVSLKVAAGERVCLFGPSGGGKTTLLRVLTGLTTPDAGRVQLTFRAVSWLFQEDRLLPWYSARQNLAIALGKDAPVGEALAAVGLSEGAGLLPRELSGGMKRRLALARALYAPFDLLVLDEPMRGLDSAMRDQMLALIDRKAGKKALLLVTHDRAEADALRCRVIEVPFDEGEAADETHELKR